MNYNDKIYVCGHTGMVGSAILRRLQLAGYVNLHTRTIQELDLRRQSEVEAFFADIKPSYVFLAAAKVGGIQANIDWPADFAYDNMMIQSNIIHSAYLNGVRKLLFLGSSCIYPRECPQPMKEEHLLTGKFEGTNEAYAIAKVAGLKMCQYYREQYGADFISVMPPNIFGYYDNFDPASSHVAAALLRRFHEAKVGDATEVVVWGTGTPRREFLFVDDLADACLFAMLNYSEGVHLNVGVGNDITIAQLAELIAKTVGFSGNIVFDTSKPDGMPRKVLDVSRVNALGWSAQTSWEEGFRKTYQWYLENRA